MELRKGEQRFQLADSLKPTIDVSAMRVPPAIDRRSIMQTDHGEKRERCDEQIMTHILKLTNRAFELVNRIGRACIVLDKIAAQTIDFRIVTGNGF